ncbi:hypothetical protein RRG08_060139 [Elysia crispata]|uniref:Uncharacterized protein n=1 Tax=Elysia crispata TaxID=231223 RepID=A0AAE1A0Z8_9GAST|nr:hypothetical protein RRG08_060139 [Elysia crispata]
MRRRKLAQSIPGEAGWLRPGKPWISHAWVVQTATTELSERGPRLASERRTQWHKVGTSHTKVTTRHAVTSNSMASPRHKFDERDIISARTRQQYGTAGKVPNDRPRSIQAAHGLKLALISARVNDLTYVTKGRAGKFSDQTNKLALVYIRMIIKLRLSHIRFINSREIMRNKGGPEAACTFSRFESTLPDGDLIRLTMPETRLLSTGYSRIK